MERDLICIICPRGCSLHVGGEKDALQVTGNACPKGAAYAVDECTHPTRTVTAVVRVENRVDTMVSVKTAAPIPKEHIFDLMEILNATRVSAPVCAGDVIVADVFGTDVVATKTIE